MTPTTISETIRGSWRYGSHARLLTRELNSLKVRGDFEATTYVFKGNGGYENEVPRCQSATKTRGQCVRTGIVNTSGGWHAAVDADGYAICSQHAKAGAAPAAPAAPDPIGSLGHIARTWPEKTGDGTLQQCACGFIGGTKFEVPAHQLREFVKETAELYDLLPPGAARNLAARARTVLRTVEVAR